MSHIVESCSLTKLNGGLSRLHSADEDAVSWLTSGSRNAYDKKLRNIVLVTFAGFDNTHSYMLIVISLFMPVFVE